MTDCLDIDTLAAVGQALDWNINERLDHLVECPSCRESLATLAATRHALATEEIVAPELINSIMASFPSRAHTRPFSILASPGLVGMMNGVLVAVLTVVVAGMAALQSGGPAPGPPSLAVGLIVGVAYWWWNRRRLVAGTPG